MVFVYMLTVQWWAEAKMSTWLMSLCPKNNIDSVTDDVNISNWLMS